LPDVVSLESSRSTIRIIEAERELAHKFNAHLTEKVICKMMGRKPLEAITILVQDLDIPETPERVLEMRTVLMRQKLNAHLEPMPGLFHIMDKFSNSLDLAIATGAAQEFLDLTLDRLQIHHRFKVFQSAEGISLGKPHPEIYLKTCQKLELLPQECIVLEDSSNGARAGKAAGCRVIAVPTEYTSGQDFSFVDYIAQDLFAAEKYISQQLEANT